jgi:hypothetical protein
MSPVHASSNRLAWSVKRQSTFGTPLDEVDLNHFLKLSEPLTISETATHWNDQGSIGAGHDWTDQRGRESQHVTFSIGNQALPVEFVGYLMGLLFSSESAAATTGGANGHGASFQALDTRPEAWVTTLAVGEDNLAYRLQDVACTSLTIKGSQNERLEAGAEFVASRIGDALSGSGWPASTPLRYLYSYAGSFSLGGDTGRSSQLRSFSLELGSGISTDLAWRRAASEGERIYPSWWPYTPDRTLKLSLSLLAESGDLAAFRAAQQNATPTAVVISCLGETISETSPAESDKLEISIPKAVFTGMNYSYQNGLMQIELEAEGNYDASTGGPLAVSTVEGGVPEFLTTS